MGSVGVPANYGGFETLAENLVAYHESAASNAQLTVYCSSKAFPEKKPRFRNSALRYVGLEANGISSIAYDIISVLDAVRLGHDRILILGVSGAIILPIVKLISRAKIIINIDGIEWNRQKWRGIAKQYLRFSEKLAVKVSDKVIADNEAIVDYLKKSYGRHADMIPYGGDQALDPEPDYAGLDALPECFALGLCRIEPENNIDMILRAFSSLDYPLVFVGNWDRSDYGRALKAKYISHPTITILDPVYEPGRLRALRNRANLYLHGHSAGGTNPALVEMMHFGIPILAHDCVFNRQTTEGRAIYFNEVNDIRAAIEALSLEAKSRVGEDMLEIAQRRYTWNRVAASYFALLET